MRLTDELAARAAVARQKRAPEIQAIMDRAESDLRRSGILDRALREGQSIPAFELPDAAGNSLSSDDLLRRGPLIISFYRGGWCAYCNLELRALQRYLPQFKALGAELVAISPELPANSSSSAEQQQLEFEVLSDVGNRVAHAFGLVFVLDEALRPLYDRHEIPIRNGDESFELPLPASYVVDTDGTVLAAFVDPDYQLRMDPEAILEVLRARGVAA